MNAEITFDCTECANPIQMTATDFVLAFKSGEQEWGQEIECPHCNQPTRIYRPYKKPAPTKEPVKESERIRKAAEAVQFWAWAFFSIAFGGVFLTGMVFTSNYDFERLVVGCSASGGLLSLSLCLFILAQLMHIRANTYRD